MDATELRSHFSPFKKGEKKVWLNFIDYAKQLFGETDDQIWGKPEKFLALFSQAQQLLKSDVLVVPVHHFYSVYLKNHPDTLQQWKGKKTTFAFKKLITIDEPRNIISEVLTGLSNLYGDRFPILLLVPSSQSWIEWLKKMDLPEKDVSVTGLEIDSATMYLTDFLRNFSKLNLSGIVLEETVSLSLDPSEFYEAYQSIFNITQHYQWPLGLHLKEIEGFEVYLDSLKEKIDFFLYEGDIMASSNWLLNKGIACGGGLDESFWAGITNSEHLSDINLAYGTIPKYAHPEKVLERIQEIRM